MRDAIGSAFAVIGSWRPVPRPTLRPRSCAVSGRQLLRRDRFRLDKSFGGHATCW